MTKMEYTNQELKVFENQNMALFENLAELEKQAKAIEAKQKEVREKLQEEMEKHGIKSIDNEIINIMWIAPTESASIDTKALRIEDPDLYHKLEEKYNKVTARKGYVRFKIK